MKTAYEILGIKIKPENTTVSVMKNLLVAQWRDYNEKSRIPLKGTELSFFYFVNQQEHLDEAAKKELFFDKYIYIMYKTQVLNNPEKEGELNQIYDLIRDQGKRAQYRKVEEYAKSVRKEAQNVRDLKMRHAILGKSDWTRKVTPMEKLNLAKNKNKAKVDPDDKFILYTGFPYRWEVAFAPRKQDLCILDDKNLKGERVIVTDLGDFRYSSNIGRPTRGHPEGKSSFKSGATILGITKFNEQDEVVSNNVMIANLNLDDLANNRRFFVDVFLCDELINEAELRNNGYLGKIAVGDVQGTPQYYIEYNGINDRELVTALGASKQVNGTVSNGRKRRTVKSFTQIRKRLVELQKEYAVSMNQLGPKSEKEKGDNLCQK